jgi:hypothetical protein
MRWVFQIQGELLFLAGTFRPAAKLFKFDLMQETFYD